MKLNIMLIDIFVDAFDGFGDTKSRMRIVDTDDYPDCSAMLFALNDMATQWHLMSAEGLFSRRTLNEKLPMTFGELWINYIIVERVK